MLRNAVPSHDLPSVVLCTLTSADTLSKASRTRHSASWCVRASGPDKAGHQGADHQPGAEGEMA